jgi:hypothetical protein
MFDWIKSIFRSETEDERLLRERPDLWYRDRSTKLWLEALTPPRIEFDHSRKILVDSPVFKVPVMQLIQEPEQCQNGSVTTCDTTEVKSPQSTDLFELGSFKETLLWRPVKFKRKQHYPDVVPDGCAWKQDGGGFSLSRQKPTKYITYFKVETIRNLEKLYGKTKPRKRKKN